MNDQHARRPGSSDLEAASISAGQLLTDAIGTPGGRLVTSLVSRWPRVHPTHLTLVGLAVGLCSAVALGSAFSSGSVVVQVLAVVGWQVAYIFDCADGQLARLTHRSSPAGGELDVFVDVAVQASMLAATAMVAIDHGDAAPLLVGLFVASWGVSMVATLLGKLRLGTWTSESLRPSSPAVWASRQLRDYALAVLVVSLAAAFSPRAALPWVMAWFTVVNLGALAVYIAARTLRSLRGG